MTRFYSRKGNKSLGRNISTAGTVLQGTDATTAHPLNLTLRRLTMNTKHLLTATVLGTLFCAVAPLAAEAGAQDEWFLQQLQMSDGDLPHAARGTPANRAPARYEGTSIEGAGAKTKTQCDWQASQQQLTDCATAAVADPACSNRSEASRYEGTALNSKPSSAYAASQNEGYAPGAAFGTAIQVRGARLFTSSGIEVSAP
jgi:hypothetical protein